MVNEVMKFIENYDPEVGKAIEQEAARQRRNLELIASENIVSEPVMMAMGTVLTNQICRGLLWKALLRRLPVHRCGRDHCNRACKEAVRL